MPDFETEFFGLPEYVVNFTRTEDAGNGFVRIYHWRKLGRAMEPTFTVLVKASDLIMITGEIQDFSIEVAGMKRVAVR